MIGQRKLQERLREILETGNFPRFSIFVGEKGSGRQTIVQNSLWSLGICQDWGSDVDSVREAIEQAYKVVSPTVYLFADADNMSVAAKNAMLKVTEEPPNNAYFIMTLSTIENTLPTIKSRATVFYMDTYTSEEVLEYYHRITRGGDEDIIKKCCAVPGDVNLLCLYDPEKFNKYLLLVMDNIEKVSGANSFKIGANLCLGTTKKDDDLPFETTDKDKYDLALFWKAFRAECLARLDLGRPLKYIAGINITSKYLRELSVGGINKQMTFDNWLLDIRKAWME